MKLTLLLEWDGPFPREVAPARLPNLRATCKDPGYEVRSCHVGIIHSLGAGLVSVELVMTLCSTSSRAA